MALAHPALNVPAAREATVADEVIGALSRHCGRAVRRSDLVVEQLRRGGRVCRVRLRSTPSGPAFIVKRITLARAQRVSLATRRWLPALGLAHIPPVLLATVAPVEASWVWQIYEDVGEVTLHDCLADQDRVRAATRCVAELHTRASGHPVVAEARFEAHDLGMHYFLSGLGDARRLLEELAREDGTPSETRSSVRDRLRVHVDALLSDAPQRARTFVAASGPDTLLHGDLWTTNVVVPRQAAGVRVIDWDRVGVGPVSYDLSTWLLRFPSADRPPVLAAYREALATRGWRLPPDRVLNVLCDTAECARYTNRIVECAVARLQDGADWAYDVLAEVLRWFEALRPVVPEA